MNCPVCGSNKYSNGKCKACGFSGFQKCHKCGAEASTLNQPFCACGEVLSEPDEVRERRLLKEKLKAEYEAALEEVDNPKPKKEVKPKKTKTEKED
jgi:transcription elongation factor Elf1